MAMNEGRSLSDRDQGQGLSRRGFVRTAGATAFAASISLPSTEPPSILGDESARAAALSDPKFSPLEETPIVRLFRALTSEQRSRLCFPFEHPLRTRVANHWAIVKSTIGDLSPDQQALCRQIFKRLCSEDGHARFLRQMNDDAGGFDNYHVALFGVPETNQPFEWVLTGRHITLRANGHGHEWAAVCGPIFYGHAVAGHDQGQGRVQHRSDHAGNVWWYQAEQADAFLASLDERQRAHAHGFTPSESKLAASSHLRSDPRESQGLAGADLNGIQKQTIQQLLENLVRPFRSFEVSEIQSCLCNVNGVDALRFTFYPPTGRHVQRDGQTWVAWKLEGSTFTWYFHPGPHVHSWFTLKSQADRP